MTKRQRCEDWWSLLVADVSNDGFVHPHLEFSTSNRTLSVSQKIAKGEEVLRVPIGHFMTKDRALAICHPWLEEVFGKHEDNIRWKNSATDLAIAVGMASSSPESFLYLHSLPDPSSFDALPRRWPEDKMRSLLAGTSLLKHVLAAKTAALEDYELLLQRYREYQKKKNLNADASSFPSFQTFSNMLSAVSSRAFQIGQDNEEIAIVPLLDLGNHTRGSTSKSGKKNVSYEYDHVQCAMIVKSSVDIDKGESIRLTYGAKANAQLLLNYGFCIPHNIEPDGSSNDILEFQPSLHGGGKSISLRAGPKSYSYGGFVAALEEYFGLDKSTYMLGTGNENSDDNDESCLQEEQKNGFHDDFEEFLGQSEEIDDFVDIYEDDNFDSKSMVEDPSDSTKIQDDEIAALHRFKVDLIKLSEGYNDCKDKNVSESTFVKSEYAMSQYHSYLLTISELRTIYFFVRAIEKVEKEKNSKFTKMDDLIEQEDLDVIDKQTDDLARAYMSIRHGGL